MDITAVDIASFAMLGAVVSAFIELIKKHLHSSNYRKAAVAGASVLLGAGYYFLQDTSWWVSILAILSISQLIYNYLLKGLE